MPEPHEGLATTKVDPCPVLASAVCLWTSSRLWTSSVPCPGERLPARLPLCYNKLPPSRAGAKPSPRQGAGPSARQGARLTSLKRYPAFQVSGILPLLHRTCLRPSSLTVSGSGKPSGAAGVQGSAQEPVRHTVSGPRPGKQLHQAEVGLRMLKGVLREQQPALKNRFARLATSCLLISIECA